MKPWTVATLLAMTVGAGLAVRLMVPAGDFPARDPLPFTDDPPYHLLRLEGFASGTSTFPLDPGARDALLAWPYGDTSIWPWGFDAILAPVALLKDTCTKSCRLNVAGMLPPILAVTTAILLFVLTSRLFGSGTGLLSSALLLLLPAHVAYTHAGRVDHHVMEPMTIVVPLLLLTGRSGIPPGSVRVAAGGLFCGLSAAFFPAAPAIAFPVFIIGGLLLTDSRQAPPWAAGMIAGLLTSLALSPFPYSWTFHSPSLWHIAAGVSLASGLIVLHALHGNAVKISSHLPAHLKKPALMLPALAGIFTVGTTVFLINTMFPEFLESAFKGLQYTSSSRFGPLSLEASSAIDSPARLMQMTGWLLPLSAAGIGKITHSVLKSGKAPETALLTATVLFILLGLVQRRFLVAATPLIAISAAVGAGWIASLFKRRFRGAIASSRVLIPVLASLMTLSPSIARDLQLESLSPLDRAMYSAADAVKKHRLQVTGENLVGALVPWGYGHLFKLRAGTATVCDNFFGIPGADAALSRCLELEYSTTEQDTASRLESLRISYVVLAPPHPEQVRAETSALGLEPDDWVDENDRFTPMFASTFKARLGLWAMNAEPGETGPFNLTLLGRFRRIDRATGETQADVLVFFRRQSS